MRYYLMEQIGRSFVVVGEVIGRVDPADRMDQLLGGQAGGGEMP